MRLPRINPHQGPTELLQKVFHLVDSISRNELREETPSGIMQDGIMHSRKFRDLMRDRPNAGLTE